MNISFIIPSRNNLKYLKWSYDSIRKNQGNHNVEICIADDNSSDGTFDWLKEQSKKDNKLKFIRNNGVDRVGHTILYDYLIENVATMENCIIYHADMYLAPNSLDAIEKHLREGIIVSLTRIEPPLHPPGPEKVLNDFGTEPELFNEEQFLSYHKFMDYKGKITDGIFAPWAFVKKDFLEIGGHDPLYRPQSKEDSDIFDRFQLNGIRFIQTWEGFVYHMTCRGSRFNPTITDVGQNSKEWEEQNIRSTRNFVRKWGRYVEHTPEMKPIVRPRYKRGLKLSCLPEETVLLLGLLEPLFDKIFLNENCVDEVKKYIDIEQMNTDYDLESKISYELEESYPIILHMNSQKINRDDIMYCNNLSAILQDPDLQETGKYELNNMIIEINQLIDINSSLIKLEIDKKQYYPEII